MMFSRHLTSLLICQLLCLLPVLFCGTLSAAEPASPAPQEQVPKMLEIKWQRGADLPQGFQDSDGGILGNKLITVGGFCSGGLEIDNKRKPGIYPRGFLKKGWELDLSVPNSQWQPLPDFPGAARQGLSASKVGESLYFWGGFSYSEPFTYQDGWKLSYEADKWVWKELPNFPWKITTVATAVIENKIYAMGGADYNAEAFFTETDRTGEIANPGSRLFVYETTNPEQGWKELPACPGTSRWVHAMASVGGKLYVLGGATGNIVKEETNYGYCTVVDNWSFDPQTNQWSRLRDLPISSGNFPRGSQLVFEDRYILLPGGYQYNWILNPDGSLRTSYGKPTSANPETGLFNNCFVYDTQTDLFGSADPLPLDNNLPMTVVNGNQIYLLGGETGGGFVEDVYYGHHPELFLIGTLTQTKPAAP